MRPYLPLAVLLTTATTAQAVELTAIVKKEIADTKSSCPKPQFKPGFLTTRDVNGDGRPDYILDYSFVACEGRSDFFCGTSGCSMSIYASMPGGGYKGVADCSDGA